MFVSYATADRKEALAVCKAIERRGLKCWISSRDVEPGENYQEAIVRSIRDGRAMVLVFSNAANNSDEIKKELSLASRHHVPVMALRIEDVEPSDAFAYELSTRQWIDAFEGWDHSIDALVGKLEQIGAHSTVEPGSNTGMRRRASASSSVRRRTTASALAVLVAIGVTGGWLWTRPQLVNPPSIGFAGFRTIGVGVAAGFPESLNQEITTAFSARQIPLVESQPNLLVHGTVEERQDGLHLTATIDDAQHKETLWSASETLDEKQGLTPHVFGEVLAFTLDCVLDRLARERRPANSVLSMFIQACYGSGSLDGRLLDEGRRMAATDPRFTGGWWAIAEGASASATLVRLSANGDSSVINDKTRDEGAAAARQLIRLAPGDAEGYRLLALLLPESAAVEKERLLRVSIAKRPEKCVCSYQDFGDFLLQSGQTKEALSIYQRGLDQGADGALSYWRVAMAQYLTGEQNASAATMENIEKTAGGIAIAKRKRLLLAMWDGRWNDAVGQFHLASSNDEKAVDGALSALGSGDRQLIDRAGRKLEQTPVRLETEFQLIPLLASLGRTDAVFNALDLSLKRRGFYSAPGAVPGFSIPLIFDPRFKAVWNNPRFGSFLQRAGFFKYWRTNRMRPDVCLANDAPLFCRMI